MPGNGPLAIAAQERDRCRREAERGPCPACGRLSNPDADKTIQQYAQANARLHARVAELEGAIDA